MVLCTNGPATFGERERALLNRNGIAVHERRVARVEGEGTAVSSGGGTSERGRVTADGGAVGRPQSRVDGPFPAC